MTINKEKNGDALTVTIAGALDIKTAPELSAALEGELDDVNEVYFDMKECDYTSSAGLRVILGTYQVMEEKDGKMALRNVNKPFMDILEVTGFLDFLDVEE
ncbi:MAG: STAS domain-containing protein [Lachnospiraceae bacterium]|nr:STAS domain-containing protein [Lachnospiraceae bacterium]